MRSVFSGLASVGLVQFEFLCLGGHRGHELVVGVN